MANTPTMVHISEYKDCTTKHKRPEEAPSAPRRTGQPDAPTWELLGPQGTASLPPSRPRCNFIHPRQLSPLPERLKLPFSSEEILSGFKDIVSSGTDQITARVKTDPHATLVRHVVDVQKTVADFREASEWTRYIFSGIPLRQKNVPKRLSICNWNPGPRRGKEDAFEKQIAGRWHFITLQEASEYVDHDILTGRFHVTLYGGCAILFNKDTYTNIDVKSIHLRDTRRDLPDQLMEGDQGWVMEGVFSRASFRRPPLSGHKTFYGYVSTYKQHQRQKERHCQEAHPHHPCYHDWSAD